MLNTGFAVLLLPLLAVAGALEKRVLAKPAATCSKDNLVRCYTHSMAEASQYCAKLAPTTYVTTTLTSSATATTTVTTSTTTVVSEVEAPPPRGKQNRMIRDAVPAPLRCMTSKTSYPASRITSACACISVAPAATITSTQTSKVTVTTTTSATALTTTTVAPVCKPIFPNPGFDRDLTGWDVLLPDSAVSVTYVGSTNPGYLALELDWPRSYGVLSQALNTVAGTTYEFELIFRSIRGDCYLGIWIGEDLQWLEEEGATENIDFGFADFSFTSAGGNDVLTVQMRCDSGGEIDIAWFSVLSADPYPVGCDAGIDD